MDCESLDRWVDSEDVNVRGRLSLRTSAVLIDGAAKLYKKQMQQLIKDVAKLDEEIVVRNRANSSNAEEESSKTSSDVQSPEQMMHQAEVHADVSMEAHTREPTFSPQAIDKRHSFSTGYKDTNSSKSTKRHSNETVQSSEQSPKKRLTNSNQSKELEEISDYSNSPDLNQEIDDETSDNGISDRETDSSAESDESTQQTNSPSETPQFTDHSSDGETEIRAESDKPTVQRPTHQSEMPQATVKHSDQQSPEFQETLSLSNNQDVNMSPTFTDLFDLVVGLPNNDDKTVYIDVRTNSNNRSTVGRNSDSNANSLTRKSDRKTDSDKNTDTRSNNGSDNARRVQLDTDRGIVNEDDDRASQRSAILMPAREFRIPKVRRNKKVSKSRTKKKDQASQSDSFYPPMSERDGNTSAYQLPFGCLLIHDSYNSRVPSKIIFSSLSDKVNRLYCF